MIDETQRITIPATWATGPDGWFFAPVGAAYHRDDQIAVVADLHLGYEATRARSGDFLPDLSLIQTQSQLSRLFAEVPVKKLVVAGDVMESAQALAGPQPAVSQFIDWLEVQGIEPLLIAGNHDSRTSVIERKSLIVHDWLIHHGDQQPDNHGGAVRGEISGHIHPILRSGGRRFRSFLTTSNAILLPAFSSDAAGCDVLTDPFFRQTCWSQYQCFVTSGTEVLDFGRLGALRTRQGR